MLTRPTEVNTNPSSSQASLPVAIAATLETLGSPVRQVFLEPSRRRLFPKWGDLARGLLQTFRISSTRYAGDPAFTELIDDLRRDSLFHSGSPHAVTRH